MGEGRNEEMGAARKALFVGHGEDAIPAGRRLIEEIFLAAFPIGAGWAVVGPLVQNDLERFLRVFPTSLPVEFMGLSEEIEAGGPFPPRGPKHSFPPPATPSLDR